MKINIYKNDTISLLDDHDSMFLNDENYADDNNYGLRVYFNDALEGDTETLERSEAEAWLEAIDPNSNPQDYDSFLDMMFDSGKEYTTGVSFIAEAEKLITKTKNGDYNTLDKTELSQLKNLNNDSNTDGSVQDRDQELTNSSFWAGDTTNLPKIRDLAYAPRDVNEIINAQTSLADINSYARLDDTINELRRTLKTQVENGEITEEEAFDIYYTKISDLRNSTNQFSQIPVRSWTDADTPQLDDVPDVPDVPDDAFWAGDTTNLPKIRDLMYAPRDVNEIINGQTSLVDINSYARLDDTINELRRALKTQVENGEITEEEAFDIYYTKISDLRNSTNQFSQIPVRSWTDADTPQLNDVPDVADVADVADVPDPDDAFYATNIPETRTRIFRKDVNKIMSENFLADIKSYLMMPLVNLVSRLRNR